MNWLNYIKKCRWITYARIVSNNIKSTTMKFLNDSLMLLISALHTRQVCHAEVVGHLTCFRNEKCTEPGGAPTQDQPHNISYCTSNEKESKDLNLRLTSVKICFVINTVASNVFKRVFSMCTSSASLHVYYSAHHTGSVMSFGTTMILAPLTKTRWLCNFFINHLWVRLLCCIVVNAIQFTHLNWDFRVIV